MPTIIQGRILLDKPTAEFKAFLGHESPSQGEGVWVELPSRAIPASRQATRAEEPPRWPPSSLGAPTHVRKDGSLRDPTDTDRT